MAPPVIETVRELCSRGRWKNAADLLIELDPSAIADFLITLPIEEQRELFRVLPVTFAASLIARFPYVLVLPHSAIQARLESQIQKTSGLKT